MKYTEVLETLDRIEAECGCESKTLPVPTPIERAGRLLRCDNPPQGLDEHFVRHLVGNRVECEDDWIA